MRSWFRVGLRVGLLAGVVCAVVVTLRSRRGDGARGNGAVGVHGDWPDVRRAPAAEPEGDHHPHGRVTVPLEAAPMGAPPAVQTAQPGRDEPEVPEPSEHLDEEATSRAPAPAAPVAPAAPAAAPVKKAAKKAAAPVKKAAEKAVAPVKKAARKAAAPVKKVVSEPAPAAWVQPEGSGCPVSHPVKAKLSSRLFHLPGMFAYQRTVPDRCYLDAAAAEADGLTRAKR